jgi:hypothetical protein
LNIHRKRHGPLSSSAMLIGLSGLSHSERFASASGETVLAQKKWACAHSKGWPRSIRIRRSSKSRHPWEICCPTPSECLI